MFRFAGLDGLPIAQLAPSALPGTGYSFQMFDPTGKPLAEIGTRGDTGGGFLTVADVNGHVKVAVEAVELGGDVVVYAPGPPKGPGQETIAAELCANQDGGKITLIPSGSVSNGIVFGFGD